MTTTAAPAPHRSPLSAETDVAFEELPAGAWRILDSRVRGDRADALLGFAEPIFDVIVVTFLEQPGNTYTCHDLADVALLMVLASRST
jgi:hypothetical protein